MRKYHDPLCEWVKLNDTIISPVECFRCDLIDEVEQRMETKIAVFIIEAVAPKPPLPIAAYSDRMYGWDEAIKTILNTLAAARGGEQDA